MVMVSAFRGVRYNPKKIDDFSKVLAPPYDVISREEQTALYTKDPHNVIRLDFPRTEGDRKYSEAAQTFGKWIDEGIFIQDSEPSIYAYYQEFEDGGRTVTRKGFIAAVKIEDFATKRILPHERTFPKPKEDRLKLTSACKANLSPVFAIYSDPEGAVERAIEENISDKPDLYAVGGDNVKNKMWKISDPGVITFVKDQMASRNLLIADGHHRYETAMNYRDIQREKFGRGSGDEPYEYVMIYLSRAEGGGLVIKPTHRVVKSLGEMSVEEFLIRLNARFHVEGAAFKKGVSNLSPKEFAVVTGGDIVLKVSPKELSPVGYKNLSVMILHSRVFGELLNEEEAGILYTKSLDEVASLVRDGEYKLGFVLPNLSPLDVFEVSLAGEKMPHKTTYFYPKLLSGLTFHLLA